MPAYVGMFKKAKKGGELLSSIMKDGPKGLLKWAKNLFGDSVTNTFKSYSQIFSNAAAGAKGAGWVVDKMPIVGALGTFGGTAAKGLDWASNLASQGTKLGQMIKGEKATGVKSRWWDQFI